MNKQIIKNTIILACITLIAGIALGLVYEITKEPIAKQQQITKEKACKAVFADAASFDTDNLPDISNAKKVLGKEFESCSIDEVVPALDKEKKCIGYAITVTCSEGYGGDVTFMVGIQMDKTVNGIEFLSLSETPGLGMNAKQPDFMNQFKGVQANEFSVTKDNASAAGEIKAISSATITSKAVVKGLNASMKYFEALAGEGGSKQ